MNPTFCWRRWLSNPIECWSPSPLRISSSETFSPPSTVTNPFATTCCPFFAASDGMSGCCWWHSLLSIHWTPQKGSYCKTRFCITTPSLWSKVNTSACTSMRILIPNFNFLFLIDSFISNLVIDSLIFK